MLLAPESFCITIHGPRARPLESRRSKAPQPVLRGILTPPKHCGRAHESRQYLELKRFDGSWSPGCGGRRGAYSR